MHSCSRWKRSSLWLVLACLLASASVLAAPKTTTLGTRADTSQPNPPLTSNADARWTDYSREPEYPGVKVLPLQFITTRAGDTLAVVVTVPADAEGKPVPGRFPAILTQTAYRVDLGSLMGSVLPSQQSLLIGGPDQYMVRRGYVSVTVDVRGTGLSSGVTALIGAEEQAAYGDAVEWITHQPWFNGNLGLAGTSYLGITALLTAAQQHPAVKAVFAEVPMGDPYRGTVAPGGLLNANFISTWLTLTQNLSVSNTLSKVVYGKYAALIEAATQDHIAAIDSWYLPTINNALDGMAGYATDDGDFWALRSPLERAKDIRAPTFLIGGSNDIFQRGVPLLYEQLKNKVTTKMVIVPGAHIQAILDAMLDHGTTVARGAPGSQRLLLRWFDHYLKGIDTDVESMPNVTQYVEGYGLFGIHRYTISTDWPHPKAKPERYYLRGNGRLSKLRPLFRESPGYLYEPEAPTISINANQSRTRFFGSVSVADGSECSSSMVQWSLGMVGLLPRLCHFNNAIVENAQDALIFETPPLMSRLYINGPIQANIWMSATNPQAALTIRVDDVDMLGRATPISTGIQSAVHRRVDVSRSRYIDGVMVQPWHPFTEAGKEPLRPGEPVLVRVEIFPAAALLRYGHRLRVAISASNQAQGVWSLPDQAEAAGNVTTIYNEPKYPSSIVVPVVPASELN